MKTFHILIIIYDITCVLGIEPCPGWVGVGHCSMCPDASLGINARALPVLISDAELIDLTKDIKPSALIESDLLG